MEDKGALLAKLSEDYFSFMAAAYPVISLSDEFHFFPRAGKAIQYLNRLDSLDEQKIKQDIAQINNLKISLEKINLRAMDLETQADYRLLSQSMAGFLQEFQQIKIWQEDPTLYLKIIILGIEQIADKLSIIKTNNPGPLISRIRQIPRLLNEARLNLKKIPLPYQESAIKMAEAISAHLKNRIHLSLNKKPSRKEIIKLSRIAIQSLGDFKIFLKRAPSSKMPVKNRKIIEDILINRFSCRRSLAEIFEIASDEYEKTKAQLKMTANHISPSKTWQGILSGYELNAKNARQLLNLYSGQIRNLKNFLLEHDLISISRAQNIRVKQTPSYLTPIRASASYSCPITCRQKEPAFFYVSIDKLKENIHQEYIFVAAHETYPGHHLLDSIRRNIKNPIRRQIESPLFYEGWASYAERLIDQFNYQSNPTQKLVGLRRQAWRAIRAKLDVGIRINKMSLADASKQLRWLGYSPGRVKAMLKHYTLTYGYQLCYTVGKFEIERLRDKFSPLLGIKKFHNSLLAGGQLPFDLIKKKLESLCRKNS
ncbi:MAG: DUF885 family protein [Candidatus Omnitrophota bacterium]